MHRSPYLISSLTILLLLFAGCGGGGGGGGGQRTAGLAILSLSGATLTPAFSPEVLDYTASVGSVTDSVVLSAGANRADATMEVNGLPLSGSSNLSLVEGDNEFTITVRVPGGTSSVNDLLETYRLTVTRAPAPMLSGLQVSAGELVPAFSPQTTSYAVDVGFLTLDTRVTAATPVGGAVIEVQGVAVASGQASASLPFVQGPNSLLVRVTTAQGESRDYTIVVTRQAVSQFAQRAYLPTPEVGIEFGESEVDIDGDTMVVGAFRDSTNGQWSGAVYVYTRGPSGQWSQQAFVTPMNPGIGDEFGRSLALDGDTLVVGAIGEDSSTQGVDTTPNEGAANSGAAYVFVRNNGIWSQQAYLKPSATSAGDTFGVAVALDGDTAVVGSYHEDTDANDSGAAYVFTRTGTSWSEQAVLKAGNAGAGDEFGVAVALQGDTIAVGAPQEDSSNGGINSTPNESESNSGAAYVFVRSGTTWSQQAYIKASNPGSLDRFATLGSLALSGDTLVVGAYEEDTAVTDSGAAYVYQRNGTSWSEQAFLKASNPGTDDRFGEVVAVRGNVVVVGASDEDSYAGGVGSPTSDSVTNSGAAYVFTRGGTTWAQQAFVKSDTGAQVGVNLGRAIALDGDRLLVSRNDGVYVFQ